MYLRQQSWKKIALMIPTCSTVQIRTHAQKYFKRQRQMEDRSSDDDQMIKRKNKAVKMSENEKETEIETEYQKETDTDSSIVLNSRYCSFDHPETKSVSSSPIGVHEFPIQKQKSKHYPEGYLATSTTTSTSPSSTSGNESFHYSEKIFLFPDPQYSLIETETLPTNFSLLLTEPFEEYEFISDLFQ